MDPVDVADVGNKQIRWKVEDDNSVSHADGILSMLVYTDITIKEPNY